jgi:hypothetical protein
MLACSTGHRHLLLYCILYSTTAPRIVFIDAPPSPDALKGLFIESGPFSTPEILTYHGGSAECETNAITFGTFRLGAPSLRLSNLPRQIIWLQSDELTHRMLAVGNAPGNALRGH